MVSVAGDFTYLWMYSLIKVTERPPLDLVASKQPDAESEICGLMVISFVARKSQIFRTAPRALSAIFPSTSTFVVRVSRQTFTSSVNLDDSLRDGGGSCRC
jgi:hypothetical protein